MVTQNKKLVLSFAGTLVLAGCFAQPETTSRESSVLAPPPAEIEIAQDVATKPKPARKLHAAKPRSAMRAKGVAAPQFSKRHLLPESWPSQYRQTGRDKFEATPQNAIKRVLE